VDEPAQHQGADLRPDHAGGVAAQAWRCTATCAHADAQAHDRDEALAEAERLLVERGVLKPGDTYAITCGEPMGYPGGTNMLKVCRVA
jgi:pyruvate kinase